MEMDDLTQLDLRSDAVQKACKRDLAAYEVNKGTIKLPYDAPAPATLIAKIAKLRAAEVNW